MARLLKDSHTLKFKHLNQHYAFTPCRYIQFTHHNMHASSAMHVTSALCPTPRLHLKVTSASSLQVFWHEDQRLLKVKIGDIACQMQLPQNCTISQVKLCHLCSKLPRAIYVILSCDWCGNFWHIVMTSRSFMPGYLPAHVARLF